MIRDYHELQASVEGAGYFTTFMPIRRVGDRIVCASHRYPVGHERQGLHGNSFWVAKRGADWFVAGWAPAIYRVPDGRRVPDLCLRLLRRQPGNAYGDFDEQVRLDFGLTEIPDDEFDELK